MPAIKWSGSKRSQAKQIVKLFPKYDRYFEPFVGGGSVLIRTGAKTAICGDICKPLIDFWNLLKTNPDSLADKYTESWNQLQEGGQQVYYDIRKRFNEKQDPADFLFLSRTCVNGLIRFNQKGEFNNAFHHTRKGINPATLKEILSYWSKRIKNYTFIHGDYTQTTKDITENDLIYMDPPYYNTKGMYYGKLDYQKFFDYLEDFNSRNIKFVLSFEGKRGNDGSYFKEIPKHLFKQHHFFQSGLSSFNKVMDNKNKLVKESLYLNY